MKYKDIKIEEDSDVFLEEGIIDVPESFLLKVKEYVCSAMLYHIKIKEASVVNEDVELLNQFKQAKSLLQRHNAKNISESTFSSLLNKKIKFNYDIDKFFEELKFSNITPELIEKVRNTNVFLGIVNNIPSNGQVSRTGDTLTIDINLRRLDSSDVLKSVQKVLSTIYHECQHVVQSLILENNNKHDKQLSRHNPKDGRTAYLQSGIEYTPQLGSLIDAITDTAQKIKSSDVDIEPKELIKTSLQNVMNDVDYKQQSDFLKAIFQKDKKLYQKTLKDVYKYVYDNIKKFKDLNDYNDTPEEELQADVDVIKTIYQPLSSNRKLNSKLIGSKEKISEIQITNKKSKDWMISIIPPKESTGDIKLHFRIGDHTETATLSPQEAMDFSEFLNNRPDISAEDLYSSIELYDRSSDVDESVIASMIEQTKKIGDLNSDPVQIKSNTSFDIDGEEFELLPEGNKVQIINPSHKIKFSIRSSAYQSFIIVLLSIVRIADIQDVLSIMSNNNGDSLTILKNMKERLKGLRDKSKGY